jgi:predicted transcriptional regulator
MPLKYISKDKNRNILDLNTRKKIYESVREFAGSNFREIVKRSKLSNGVTSYHLHYLIKHNLIKQEKRGNSVIYFPMDFKIENSKLLSILRQRSMRNIVLFILNNKNCEHGEIVNFTGLSPSTVTWHLKKLENEKIIASSKQGRTKNYQIIINPEEIIDLLIIYKESFFDSLVDNIVETWDLK